MRKVIAIVLILTTSGAFAQVSDEAQSQWASEEEQFQWWRSMYEHYFPTEEPALETEGLVRERFRPPPEPGVHPRVFFNPEEVPAIKTRMETTALGKKADSAIRKLISMLDNNEVYDDLANGKHDKVFMDKFRGESWNLSLAMMYKGFVCLLDDDKTGAEKLARALTRYAEIVQRKLDDEKATRGMNYVRNMPDRFKEFLPHGQHWQSEVQWIVQYNTLGLCYDFIHKWMNEEQRRIVRGMIASSSNNTWSHAMGVPGLAQENWSPFHWRASVQALCIEGEEGYDPKVVEATAREMKQYFTYGFSDAGALFEGLGKGNLGTAILGAFAKRGHWFIAYPKLKRSVDSFALHSIQPWGGMFHTYGGLGGATGTISLENIVPLKFAYPKDLAIDYVYRNAMGENLANVGDINPHPAMIYFHLYYALYGEEVIGHPDMEKAARDLKAPLTWFDPHRAQMITRSDWSQDALYMHFHVRQLERAHVRDESGMFSLSAMGRIWALYPSVHHRGPFGEAREARFHNVVLIDDVDTGNRTGLMIDFAATDKASFGASDQKPAWDWTGVYGNPSKAWVPDNDTPNDKIGIPAARKTIPGFNLPYSEHPHWIHVGTKIGPMHKIRHYPVDYAFRSAGMVRGLHPYVIVMDDIRKDNGTHTYKWLMQVQDDIDVVGGNHEDIILAENSGDRRLLVRVLQSEQADDRFSKMGPGYLETYPAYANPVKGKRLIVPSHSVNPKYKILLYPFREGDALPKTRWDADQNRLSVEWDAQKDVFEFVEEENGRTTFSIKRKGETIFTFKNGVIKQ